MTTLAAVEPAAPLDPAEFPKGTVIVPCHDLARYHQFSFDLTLLDVPDGTEITFQRSASIVQNLNQGIGQLLRSESAWAWIVGDDHSFNRDTIMRLLAHDVDIVAPLCVKRAPPFSLVAYDREEGLDPQGRMQFNTMEFEDLPEDGLFEVAAAGTAGMLIKREVFEALEEPWFLNSDGLTTNEDVTFCRRARAEGFKVLLDPGTRIGHLGIVAAWPDHRDGAWGLTLDFQGAGHNQIFIPGGIRLEHAAQVTKGGLSW